MPNLGSAYIQIVPSARGIGSTISKELNKEAGGSGKSAGNTIAGTIKKVLIGAGIGTALGMALKEGGQLEQSLGGIETLFKKSADIVKKNAADAYKTAGISANEYMQEATSFSASLLQSLGGDTQKAASYADMAIKDMSDNANKMGSNMTDIQNAYQGFARQNYMMLDNLKLGYGGTQEEMKRLLADAEKITGKKYDISNLADVYEAIHIMQEELNITGTTSKEAASTLEGSFNSMKASAQNFLGNLVIGENVNESMKQLVSTTTTFLFNNLIPAVGSIIAGLPGAVGTAVETADPLFLESGKKLAHQFVNGVKEPIEKLKQWFSTYQTGVEMLAVGVGGLTLALAAYNASAIIAAGASMAETAMIYGMIAAETVAAGATTALGAAIGFLTSPITIVIAAIAGLVAVGIYLYRNWDNVRAKAGSLAKGISSNFNSIRSKVSSTWNSVKSSTVSTWNGVKNAITKPIESAKRTVLNIITKIKSAFKNLKIKMPHVPSLHVSWGNTSRKGKGKGGISINIPIPHLSWYKTGGIFDDPSIIGVGEAGSEAVVPLAQLWRKFDQMADSIVNGVNTTIKGLSTGNGGDIQLNVYLFPNGPKMGEYIVNTYDTYKRRLG